MSEDPTIIYLGHYSQRYGLEEKIIGLVKSEPPAVEINRPGLIMHGSEVDPYGILKYGLIPQQTTRNNLDTDWQVCLGLNSPDANMTIGRDRARKNSAVKFAGNFSAEGMVYVINPAVKELGGYMEYWDPGEGGRGYAWVTKPISAELIHAVITENLPHAAAAMKATQQDKPLIRPDGTNYKLKDL